MFGSRSAVQVLLHELVAVRGVSVRRGGERVVEASAADAAVPAIPSIVELDDAREGGGDGGGKIALVAAVEKSRLSVPRSVRVWALQACGRAWAEADRMPADVHARFCAAEAGRGFECVANGGVIAFTIKAAAAAAAAAAEVLLFDSIRKEWRWARRARSSRHTAAAER
uniref:Uncharacterized protein n=1 Tax=Ananas comosus var. bracteatus TaxID=296719 RepID=A0A6V7PUX1_ANACO|nr:unnamed protein product [Ananas comosus var. bracteatus]